MDFHVVKEREEYKIYNDTLFPGYYTITKVGCSLQELPVQSGNFSQLSPIHFIPDGDGDYVVTMTIGKSNETPEEAIFGKTAMEEIPEVPDVIGEEENTLQVTISHYPLLIEFVIKDLRDLLCDDCGCNDTSDGCTSAKAKMCLKSQAVLGNMGFLMGVLKTINCNNTDTNVIQKASSLGIQTYKCEMMRLFCGTVVERRINGDYEYDGILLKKILSIYYLMLYFYEKEITNPEAPYLEFLDKKYDFKTMKACILKSEIDVSLIENLFTEIYYDACGEPEIVCDLSCFKPVNNGMEKLYEFEINEALNGIYDSIVMKNTCGSPQLFMNRVIYQDATFKMMIKAQSSTNPTSIAPGEEFVVNVVFQGTKPVYTLLNLPIQYEGSYLNTYKILFKDTTVIPNNPPVITDIVKVLNTRAPYTFTVADFENYFTDMDGDILDKIVLTGSLTNYTLSGIPYTAGTVITRANITNLVYTPLAGTEYYEIVVYWTAYDSRGAQSN